MKDPRNDTAEADETRETTTLNLDRDAPIVEELRARAEAIRTPQGRLNFAANVVVAAAFIAIEERSHPEDMKRAAAMALLMAGSVVLGAAE